MSTQKEKRNIGKHACERCRQSKTRCLLDTLDAHGKCRKCHTANLECTWKAISTNRRRKRTDVRVSELENQVKSLESALTNLGRDALSIGDEAPRDISLGRSLDAGSATREDDNELNEMGDHGAAEVATNMLAPDDAQAFISPGHRDENYDHLSKSSMKADLCLSEDRQAELIQDFVTRLLPQYPIIELGSPLSFESLSTSKPLLTSALLTAASSISEPRMFEDLHAGTMRRLSVEVLVKGQKSLELVQALLICAVWFNPPSRIENLTFQLCNMAGTMALELGLGGRTSRKSSRRVVAAFRADVTTSGMEVFRTMFSVYLTCSRVAVSLRRQCMVSFNAETHDALSTFAEHATSLNDKRLVAWVKLQLIAEDIERMKTNMEAHEGSAGFSANRKNLQEDISLFVNRLSRWEAALESGILNESLRIDLCFCKCKLHELVIYADHNVEDLSITSIAPANSALDHPASPVELTPNYIRALLAYTNDCRSILDAVLVTDVVVLRCCPLLTHLRIPYAFKALAMLQKALASPGESNVKKVIDNDSLNFGYYVSNLSTHMERASCQGLYSAPNAALRIRDLVTRSSARCSESNQRTDLTSDKSQSYVPGSSTDLQPNVSQPSESGDSTTTSGVPTGVLGLYNDTAANQLDEFSLLPLIDDTNAFYFNWTPEFMDWS